MSKKIQMKKANDKTFDYGFKVFITEHCELKNMRKSTIRYYKQIMEYSFYNYYDRDNLLTNLKQADLDNYILYLKNNKIKDTTINIYLKGLKCVISFYKAKNWIDGNYFSTTCKRR